MATPVKFGSEFLVNTTLAFDQFAPTITGLADGRFMVAWANGSATYPSFPGSGDDAGFAIRAQMYNADGSTFGTEFLEGAATGGYRSTPATTALIGGRFVVAWTDEDTTATDPNAAIRAQIYNPDGSAFGGVIQLNTTTTGVQAIPSISALANGGFVATWQDYSLSGGDTSAWAVRGQTPAAAR